VAGNQLDRALDDIDTAMRQLKEGVARIPVRRDGFKQHHDRMAKAVATLTTELVDARTAIRE